MKLLIVVVSLLAVTNAYTNVGNTLPLGRCFGWTEVMRSTLGCMHVHVQRDGNMVVYRSANSAVVWATNTVGRGGYQACMQGDGNFVLTNPTGGGVWAANTTGRGRSVFLFESGNYVVRDATNTIIWQSGRTSPC